MRSKLFSVIALISALGGSVQAHAQTRVVPADLVPLPRCVWNKLKIDARAPLVAATEARDEAATDRAVTDLRASTLQSAASCAPSINQDQTTGDEVLVNGLRQEAAGDLIARDLKISRTQLDRAIAAAPPTLTTSLRKIANQLTNRLAPDPAPSLSPIFTALKLPASGPANPKQANWLTSYVVGYFRIRAAAAQYDSSPKP
jgi:hypothetical protein